MKKNIVIIILVILSLGLGIGLFVTYNELSNQKEEIEELEEKIDKYKSEASSEKEENSSNENYDTKNDALDEISYNQFKKMIENEKTFLIVFTQTGCSHCTAFKPTINEIIEEEKINIYELDIGLLTQDEWNELTEMVSVTGTPTLTSIKNGMESDDLVGNRDKDTVLEFLLEEEFISE